MGRTLRAGAAFAVLALLVVAVASGSTDKADQSSTTLVFGAAADPVVLDAALISDGESFRVVYQITETLVGLKPGTTKIVPLLARSWKTSANGKTWTFTLRRGVTFHDGTPFNAAAVCANFDRWYNFKGAQQSSSASYYYNYVFSGFKTKNPGGALYKSCKAARSDVAVITLKRPYGPFLAAMTLSPFAIQSPTSMAQNGADKGRLTSDGVYQPLGKYGVPGGVTAGTGPFKLQSWRIGDKLELVRNDSYWGRKPTLTRLIFRAIPDNAARLQALQTGEIDGYDLVEPQDISTINRNRNLKTLDRPAFNVAYVGINRKVKPFDNLLVRKAVAHGLNRAGVVKSFYAGRGTVAHEFMPPSVPGYSTSVPKYPYNPNKAKALLRQAGLTLPVELEFWWPTDVSRPYMPNPKNNFQAFAASLNASGFKVVAKSAPWNPTYLGRADAGTAGALHLLGWTGDFGDASTFLDGILRSSKQFGLPEKNPLYTLLDKALVETSPAKRNAIYRQANNWSMQNVVGVPYAHTRPALAFKRTVVGYVPSPTTSESFASVRKTG
jgi:peptide/nickel transport system substrate-binding protein